MNQEPNKTFSLDELKRISEGDEKFVSEMIVTFIETTRHGLSEIDKAFDQQNFALVSGYAHKIASPCLHMGAFDLRRLLKNLETESKEARSAENIKKLIDQIKSLTAALIHDLNTELNNRRMTG